MKFLSSFLLFISALFLSLSFPSPLSSIPTPSPPSNTSHHATPPIPPSSPSAFIQSLYDELSSLQYTSSTPYQFLHSWRTVKGLFPSYATLNVILNTENPLLEALVDAFQFPDANGFISSWVGQILMETSVYQTINNQYLRDNEINVEKDNLDNTMFSFSSPCGSPLPQTFNLTQMELILSGLTSNFHSGNYPLTTPIMDFWTQYKVTLANGSTTWVQDFENLAPIVKMLMKIYPLVYLIVHTFFPIFDPAVGELGGLDTTVFHLPPDSDDTAVVLQLGGLIGRTAETLGSSGDKGDMMMNNEEHSLDNNNYDNLFSYWQYSLPGVGNNTNPQSLIDLLSQYSYRPWSTDRNENSMDPRSYYWIREYLYEIQNTNENEKGNSLDRNSLMLITTWIMNYNESKAGVLEGGSRMPLNVNNVDGTVCANTMLALVSIIQQSYPNPMMRSNKDNSPNLLTPKLLQLLTNTTDLLIWILNKNLIATRPDIILLYYPSPYDFYWFMSRYYQFYTAWDYEYFQGINQEFYEFFSETEGRLRNALISTAVPHLLSLTRFGNSSTVFTSGEPYTSPLSPSLPFSFYDDFLGNADTPIPHYDDRIFSSAQALNTYMNIYSQNGNGSFVVWESGYPLYGKVYQIMGKLYDFLFNYALSGEFKLKNAFFSGSAKGYSTLPMVYPTSYSCYLNDTCIDVYTIPIKEFNHYFNLSTFTQWIEGVMDNHTYNTLIKKRPFEYFLTPIHFRGYNDNTTYAPLPYWSSDALTLGVTMLASTKWITINNLNGECGKERMEEILY